MSKRISIMICALLVFTMNYIFVPKISINNINISYNESKKEIKNNTDKNIYNHKTILFKKNNTEQTNYTMYYYLNDKYNVLESNFFKF